MILTGTHVSAALKAAGAGSGLVATPQAIADLFNDAISKYGGGLFTTVNTYAALVSECMMESAYFKTTEEYNHTKGSYQPYRGRTFIQVTWKANYAEMGAWCKSVGLLTDANYFVKNPSKLADLKWAAIGGVWYFTQKKFSGKPLTAYADSSLQVGRAVNMGSPFSKSTPSGQKARDAAYVAVQKALKANPPVVVTPPPVTPDDPVEAPVALSQTKRVEWKNSGHYVDERTHAQLEAVEEILGYSLVMYQGSWSNGSESADTHAGAGAADVGPPSRELETACRKVGMAAWWRHTGSWADNKHVHALSIGNSHLAAWAKVQVQAYLAGYDGLGANARAARDTGTRSYVKVTWEDVQEDYLMPSADDLIKAMTKSKPLLAAIAQAVHDLDVIDNSFTSNAAGNPTVSMDTALNRLGTKVEAIRAAVVPTPAPPVPVTDPVS